MNRAEDVHVILTRHVMIPGIHVTVMSMMTNGGKTVDISGTRENCPSIQRDLVKQVQGNLV